MTVSFGSNERIGGDGGGMGGRSWSVPHVSAFPAAHAIVAYQLRCNMLLRCSVSIAKARCTIMQVDLKEPVEQGEDHASKNRAISARIQP
jgi:hypothetical protein